MSAREGGPADGVTPDLHGQHGIELHEIHDDTVVKEQCRSWGLQKLISNQSIGLEPEHPLDLIDRSRVRVHRSLKRARAWRARIDTLRDRYYQKWIIEGLLRQKPLPPSKEGRRIPFNPGAVRREPLIDERSGRHFSSNYIRSNRYTILSFLPKQIFAQFSRLANFYFLVIGILQQIPGWSPTGSFTQLGPLLAFIALIMAKEAWDDYRRYLLDREDNLALVSVIAPSDSTMGEESTVGSSRRFGRKLKEGQVQTNEGASTTELVLEGEDDRRWTQIKWQDIRVGDIVRLERNERVPADLALLHATGVNSVAYIDTMALDGETNLKSKQPPTLLAGRCDTIEKLKRCSGELICEDPNADLYQFEGRLTIDGEVTPLTVNEVVFRGSTIRNTSETIGLVINTGEECKIRMNSTQYVHTKSPKINRFTNRIVLSMVVILLGIVSGISGGYVLWQRQYESKNEFLSLNPVSAPALVIGTLILISALIPLSLYIFIEIVKVFQAYNMNDIEMYDAATDTPISINTNTILEDLGQVNYVFSDKTGTLTENNMQFRRLTVGGTTWLHTMNMSAEEAQKGAEPKATDISDIDATFPAHTKQTSKSRSEPTTATMLDYIRQFPHTAFSQQARQFLLCIALCHTCLPETSSDGKITFQAASPDEVALVQAAQDMGYLLLDRPARSIKLRFPKESGELVVETYAVLKVIEFSSNRKRMSIVVRMPDGRICVICKGADNVLMRRLRLAELAAQTVGEVDRQARERHSVQVERESHRRSMAVHRPSYHGRRSGLFSGTHSVRSSRETRRLSKSGEEEEAEVQEVEGDIIRTPRNEQPPKTMGFSDAEEDEDEYENDDNYSAINETTASSPEKVLQTCFQHIDTYATEGLRILLYGYRYLSASEYATWETTYQSATTSLADRQQRIEAAAETIETNLELAGASAIEDKLQRGVPETIDKLRRASIKVWMLTGDKRETAVNIAKAAGLVSAFSEVRVLDGEVEGVRGGMARVFADVGRWRGRGGAHFVLVVDGGTLGGILGGGNDGSDDEEAKILEAMFFELAVQIDSVICCRASPHQKAALVQGIRDADPSCVTLAIGDGANDIAMIQASHVGIGISGREGLQAARVADYGIAQFRFLQRLLLVHGHWL